MITAAITLAVLAVIFYVLACRLTGDEAEATPFNALAFLCAIMAGILVCFTTIWAIPGVVFVAGLIALFLVRRRHRPLVIAAIIIGPIVAYVVTLAYVNQTIVLFFK